jgi:hypothetical protein
VPCSPFASGRGERRTSRRYTCRLSVIVGKEFWRVPIHNLAAHGIACFLGRALEPGTEVRLELEDRRAGLLLLKTARVVHATAAGDDEWLTGLAFLQSLSTTELNNLLQSSQMAQG